MQPILIIGAGPAGLATAAQLTQAAIPYILLEKETALGSAWRTHYDRLHLHTVKKLSHLPGLAFPDHHPRFVSRQAVVDYLEQYAKHFNIKVQTGVSVTAIEHGDSHRWRVRTANGEHYDTDHCVVCTGMNHIPFMPETNGTDIFQGKIIHSKDYRNPEPFKGQKVLTVGMGNSGAEIALDLAEQGVESFLSVRAPVNIVPREIFGRSTQETAIKLAKLPNVIGDTLGVVLRKLMVGNLKPWGIETPSIPPAAQLRELGKTPVIDIGTVAAIRRGEIKVVPAIAELKEKNVVFTDGQELPIDTIIFATGYRSILSKLLPQTEQNIFNDAGLPRELIGEKDLQGLYFLGYDNHSAGGTLAIIRRDAPKVIASIETSS